MDDEKKSVQSSSPYTITTSIIQNQLTITLDDNNTKQKYKSSFTPHLLKKCGFNDKQIKNLSAIKKLIQTAEAGQNDLKLTITIDNGKKDDININDDADDAVEGGVHGIDVTKAKDIIAPAAVSVELAVITITKEDDFFGAEFVLKLAKVEREQSQINADIIRDMMMEMSAIRQKLEECEKQSRGQEAKIVKLEEITKSQTAEIEEKRKGISGLIARVDVLEQKANAQRNQNKKLEDDVLEKQKKIEELEGMVRDQAVQIEELGKYKEEVNGMRGRVAGLEGKIRGYDGRIGGLEQGLDKRGKEIKILNDGKDIQGKEIKDLVKITKSQEGKIGKLEKETQALSEAEQKEETVPVHFAKYASTKEEDVIQWNIVKQEPTLNNMIRAREDNNRDVVFGVAGLYRITYRWTSDEDNDSSYRVGQLRLNGAYIQQSYCYNSNANGQITDIININKGDKIQCYCQNKKGTTAKDCSLIIERLGDRL